MIMKIILFVVDSFWMLVKVTCISKLNSNWNEVASVQIECDEIKYFQNVFKFGEE